MLHPSKPIICHIKHNVNKKYVVKNIFSAITGCAQNKNHMQMIKGWVIIIYVALSFMFIEEMSSI